MAPIQTNGTERTDAQPYSGANSIPLSKPYFDGTELTEIQATLESGWVTQGPRIARFEQSVSSYVGAQHAVATSNCTTAMHVAWLILGIGKGDEVLCPSYSFIASANAIRHAEAEPVFIDIQKQTLNLDPELTRQAIIQNYEKLVNKKTGRKLKAVLLVHQIGLPCDLHAFEEIAKEFGLVLVEDAACAIGSEYNGKKIGNSGNICAFSFHPRKVVTTGEGGMLTLSSKELEAKARIFRAHGMSISDLDRHNSASTTFEQYEVVGYNYRMTDIQASIGIRQMTVLDEILAKRQCVGDKYREAFRHLEHLSVIEPAKFISKWNHQSFPIRLSGPLKSYRNEMMEELHKSGVSTRRGIPPIHLEPIYKNGLHLPNTEEVSETSIFLPIFAQMTDREIDHVVDKVTEAYRKLCN